MRSSSSAIASLLPVLVAGLLAAAPAQAAVPLHPDGSDLDLSPDTPEVLATLAADGSYTIRLVPQGPWTEAELTVSGDGSHELAAVDGASPVLVEGVRDGMGPIGLTLAVVTPDRRGVSWSFTVEPELLPVKAPSAAPADGSSRRKKRRRDR